MNIQRDLINIHWTPVLALGNIKMRKIQYRLLTGVHYIVVLKYSTPPPFPVKGLHLPTCKRSVSCSMSCSRGEYTSLLLGWMTDFSQWHVNGHEAGYLCADLRIIVCFHQHLALFFLL